MDELFTSKSDTSINQNKRKNNTQIISSLRSETETEKETEKEKKNNIEKIQSSQKNTVSVHFPTQNVNVISPSSAFFSKTSSVNVSNMESIKNKKNDDNLQEDIVNIAESLHNLVKMIDEQREKMNTIEKEILKIGGIENEINKINENVKTMSNQSKNDKNDQYKPNRFIKSINKSSTNLDNISISSTAQEISSSSSSHPIKNEQKNILLKGDKKENQKDESKNKFKIISINKNSDHSKKHDTVSESCYSESSGNNAFNNSKELDKKLNNITKEFNSELLDMKRKQALIAASYMKLGKR